MSEPVQLKINTEKNYFQKFSVYDLVSGYDSILRTPCKRFEFSKPPIDPVYLTTSLFETMFKHKGIGLSANQCGIPYAVFVAGDKTSKQVFFNPEILEQSDEYEEAKEGCISFPLFVAKIKRPKWVKLKWQHVDQQWYEETFHGLTARIIFHEMDHMEGLTLHDKIGKTSLMLAKRKQEKLTRQIKNSAKKRLDNR